MYVLPKNEASELLEDRVAALDTLIERAERGIGEAAQRVPAVFLSEERYAQHMRIAERDWVLQFAGCLRSGQLRWPEAGAQL